MAIKIVDRKVRTKSLRPGGHYRAGRRHPDKEFAVWPAGVVSEDELARMREDPDLVVELGAEPAPAPEAAAAKKEKK